MWGVVLTYPVLTTYLTYNIVAADNTGSNYYDVGIANASGTILLDIGATAGTTFAPDRATDIELDTGYQDAATGKVLRGDDDKLCFVVRDDFGGQQQPGSVVPECGHCWDDLRWGTGELHASGGCLELGR
jgi:hypothetical protein